MRCNITWKVWQYNIYHSALKEVINKNWESMRFIWRKVLYLVEGLQVSEAVWSDCIWLLTFVLECMESTELLMNMLECEGDFWWLESKLDNLPAAIKVYHSTNKHWSVITNVFFSGTQDCLWKIINWTTDAYSSLKKLWIVMI